MPQRLEPWVPSEIGTVELTLPGTDAETLERLVTTRVEQALLDLHEVRSVDAHTRDGAAILVVSVDDGLAGDADAWDAIDARLDAVTAELGPQFLGLSGPRLSRPGTRWSEVVLALRADAGDSSPPVAAAHALAAELRRDDAVSRVGAGGASARAGRADLRGPRPRRGPHHADRAARVSAGAELHRARQLRHPRRRHHAAVDRVAHRVVPRPRQAGDPRPGRRRTGVAVAAGRHRTQADPRGGGGRAARRASRDRDRGRPGGGDVAASLPRRGGPGRRPRGRGHAGRPGRARRRRGVRVQGQPPPELHRHPGAAGGGARVPHRPDGRGRGAGRGPHLARAAPPGRLRHRPRVAIEPGPGPRSPGRQPHRHGRTHPPPPASAGRRSARRSGRRCASCGRRSPPRRRPPCSGSCRST